MDHLSHYRKRIDEIDDQLLDLFAERFDIVRAVGKLKAENNIQIVQSARVEEVIERVTAMAEEKHIPPAFIKDLYTRMIDLAHIIENDILDNHDQS
ncbi:MAG: chorismate mutase [Alphaproteobacteria bacterium]